MRFGFLLVVAACGLWTAAAEAQPAPSGAPTPNVAIPNFWDPRQRAERPAEGAVPAIRFLTTDDLPPFSFINDRGQLTGFNVDLARAICADLAVPCTIQVRSF